MGRHPPRRSYFTSFSMVTAITGRPRSPLKLVLRFNYKGVVANFLDHADLNGPKLGDISQEHDYMLIRVNVERIEVVSPHHGIAGDSVSWRPPSLHLRRPP